MNDKQLPTSSSSPFPVLFAIGFNIFLIIALLKHRPALGDFRALAALFIHWSLAGYIFGYPLARAYIAGLSAARDPMNRLTLVGPWFHFWRKFWPVMKFYFIHWTLYFLAFWLFYENLPKFAVKHVLAVVFQAFVMQNLLALVLAARFLKVETLNASMTAAHELLIFIQFIFIINYANSDTEVLAYILILAWAALAAFVAEICFVRFYRKTAWFRLDYDSPSG